MTHNPSRNQSFLDPRTQIALNFREKKNGILLCPYPYRQTAGFLDLCYVFCKIFIPNLLSNFRLLPTVTLHCKERILAILQIADSSSRMLGFALISVFECVKSPA